MLGAHVTQCGLGRGLYLHSKFHVDQSNRLATIHSYSQTERQDNDETIHPHTMNAGLSIGL